MIQTIRPIRRSTVASCALLTAALVSGFGAFTADAQARYPKDIQYPELPEFKPGKPERIVLPNGIVVLLSEDHELPLIRASVLVRTSSRLEPSDRAGLAQLVGATLRTGGTRNLTGDQIDDLLDGKGASIETSINENQGSASLFALNEDFPEVFRLLGEMIRHPVFDAAKIEVAKTSTRADIARQNDDPQDILFRELGELVYGQDSPLIRQPTYASIDAIKRDDLVSFHREYFQPNRLIVGLVGDFQRAEALALVEKTFGDWQSNRPAGDPNMYSPAPPAAGIYFIEKNDVTQSSIAMGNIGIVRRNPDYFAVELMNQVLSGSFTSRLFSEVRTRRGLAYNVFGNVGSQYDRPGLTLLFTSTKAETTGAAIDALLTEARRMTSDPPSEEEVARARRSILSSFIFQVDTPQKILAQQLNYEYYGYPLDWLENYRRRIEEVTTEQVREAAKKYLVPERFAIVVVGPKDGRDTDLTKYGTVQTIDIAIPQPAAAKLSVTPAGQERAKALLDQVVAAAGGADQVDGIHTLRQVAKAVQSAGGQSMEATVTGTFQFPDYFRQEIQAGGQQMVLAVTPQSAFMTGPQGTMALPDSMADSMRRDFRRNYLFLLKSRNAEDFNATVAEAAVVDGTSVERVQIEYRGDLTTISIDPETRRILESSYQGAGPNGAPGTILQKFSDFRAEGGLVLPHRVVSLWNDQAATDLSLMSVEVNPAIDLKIFETPPLPGH